MEVQEVNYEKIGRYIREVRRKLGWQQTEPAHGADLK